MFVKRRLYLYQVLTMGWKIHGLLTIPFFNAPSILIFKFMLLSWQRDPNDPTAPPHLSLLHHHEYTTAGSFNIAACVAAIAALNDLPSSIGFQRAPLL